MRNELDTSYPSAPITFADVPEIKKFHAEFIYNFFTPDESIVDTGIELRGSINNDVIRRVERIAPRMVKFTFTPVQITNLNRTGNEFRGDDDTRISPPLMSVANKVVREFELTTSQFVGTIFQDGDIDAKLYEITSGSVSRKIERYNRNIANQFHASEDAIKNVLSREHVNLYDAAKLMSIGRGERDAKLIVRALNQLRALNAQFIDDDTQRMTIDEKFERIKSVGAIVQFNAKFVRDLLQSALRDPFGLFIDQIRSVIARAADMQSRTLASVDPSIIDPNEFEPSVEPIATRRVDIASFDTRARVIGYIVDKFEIDDGGNIVAKDPIIVDDAAATIAFDTNVAYNRRYMYSIRAVVEVELVALTDDGSDVVAATIMLSSRRSRSIQVTTVDNVPPPPPVDFRIDWDRRVNAPRLMWSFPVNPQRDIKKWQVFRRKNIYEPFELIKQYDFDDSFVKAESGEIVDDELNERVTSPINYYIDVTHKKGETYIYAVCAIDAHGMTSNYSQQIRVKFDLSKNDLSKEIVSRSGAPKSYPNVYVTQDDVFVDTIRDSGHRQVDVYFDPEILDVVDARGQKLGLLATDITRGVYRLQFVNVDLQQGDAVDIIVRDLR